MILIMGPAGAGKSVQGTLLGEARDMKWLSTGEILRASVDPQLKERMLTGELISDELVESAVEEAIRTMPDDQEVILDGFPRTVLQADWLADKSEELNRPINAVIHIRIDADVAKARLLERGRQDDVDDAIAKRHHEYQTVTMPIINKLKDKGIEIIEIEGDQSIEAVHAEVLKKCDQCLRK